MLKFNQFLIKENKVVEDAKVANLKNRLDVLINNQLKEFKEHEYKITTDIIYYLDVMTEKITTCYGFSIDATSSETDEETSKMLMDKYYECINLLISKFGDDNISMSAMGLTKDKKYNFSKNSNKLDTHVKNTTNSVYRFRLSNSRSLSRYLTTLISLKVEDLTASKMLSMFPVADTDNRYHRNDSGEADGMIIPINDFIGGIVPSSLQSVMREYILKDIQKYEVDYTDRLEDSYNKLAHRYLETIWRSLFIPKKYKTYQSFLNDYEEFVLTLVKEKHKDDIEHISIEMLNDFVKKSSVKYLKKLGMPDKNFLIGGVGMCLVPFTPPVNTMFIRQVKGHFTGYDDETIITVIPPPQRLLDTITFNRYEDGKAKDVYISDEIEKIKLDSDIIEKITMKLNSDI
jgi:hypothetical protein